MQQQQVGDAGSDVHHAASLRKHPHRLFSERVIVKLLSTVARMLGPFVPPSLAELFSVDAKVRDNGSNCSIILVLIISTATNGIIGSEFAAFGSM